MGQGAPAPTAKPYSVPRTPWGEPDLQGKWPGTDLVGVPMQRAEARDAERAQRRGIQAAPVSEFATPGWRQDDAELRPRTGRQFDAWRRRRRPGLAAAALARARQAASRRRRSSSSRPTAACPRSRAEAQAARSSASSAAPGAAQGAQGHEAESYHDRSLYDRCISLGIADSVPPVSTTTATYRAGPGLGGHSQRDDSRDARHSDRRAAQRERQIKSWMGNSAGAGRATRLVVTTPILGSPASAVNGGSALVSERRRHRALHARRRPQLDYEMTVNDPKT